MTGRLSTAIRVLAIAAVAAGLWWFIRAMDFATLGRAFLSAKLWPLALAGALNAIPLWCKALAWRFMLAPRHHVSTLRLFRLHIATCAASAIAPARAGEVLRVWSLKRRDGVPIADTAAVAVAEKLLDGITIVVFVAPLPWLIDDLPTWIATAIALCAAVALAAFLGLVIAIGYVDRRPTTAPPSWLRRFLAGMHILRSPRRLLATMGVLFVVWATDLGMVMAVLYAVDIHVPIAAGVLILFTLNLTIAIPSTPAQVGALEVGALAAIDILGVNHEAGLAFALLYHAVQVIPLVIAGLLLELRLVLGRDLDERSEPGAPEPGAPRPP